VCGGGGAGDELGSAIGGGGGSGEKPSTGGPSGLLSWASGSGVRAGEKEERYKEQRTKAGYWVFVM
jgi:hypothetical protein